MATEHPGRCFNYPQEDVALVYFVMPFGRNGSPSHFSVVGDAITAAHCAHEIQERPRLSRFPALSRMYVDDGICVEIEQAVRLKASTDLRGKFARGLLCRHSINQEKLDDAGQWSRKHIILGIGLGSESLQVRLPDAKVASAYPVRESLGREGVAIVTRQETSANPRYRGTL